jgi:hypothetical protein
MGMYTDPSSRGYSMPYPGSTGSEWTTSTYATSSSALDRAQASASATVSSPGAGPSGIVGGPFDHKHIWEELASGAKIGIVLVVVIGVIGIALFAMWFCCGCCGGRCCGKRRRSPQGLENRGDLPLSPIHGAERRGRQDDRGVDGDLPPPQYAEAVPPQHQTIAGGITHVREEEEGVISDGKTPLSEIPFEDVVLDHPVSAGSGSGSGSPSSAREFAMRHHGMGGDTRGHTNS